MRIINANATYLSTAGYTAYEFIELIGRTCYKSQDMIKEGTAVKFAERMAKSKHYAMLEHYHTFFKIPQILFKSIMSNLPEHMSLADFEFINITDNKSDTAYISGSFRAWIELNEKVQNTKNKNNLAFYHVFNSINNRLAEKYPELFTYVNYDNNTSVIMFSDQNAFIADVKALNIPKTDKDDIIRNHATHSIKFICDRGVTHEFVRHRPASFAQESTRYCNYAQDKFGREITFIRPCFWGCDAKIKTDPNATAMYNAWQKSCELSEKYYFEMIDAGAIAQQARDVLSTSVKTELIITATEKEWQHIINLRYHGITGAPHPQMVEVMTIAYSPLTENTEKRIG